jgi:hypothetical protein
MVVFLLLVFHTIPLIKTANDLEVRHHLRVYQGDIAIMVEHHPAGKTSRRDKCQDRSSGFRSTQRSEWLIILFLTLPSSVAS